MTHSGTCLCGQTKIEIVGDPYAEQSLCHCTDCRQTSGSAFSTNIVAPQKDVTITGPIKNYYSKAASGNTVTRVYCGNCGAAVTHKSPGFGDNQAVQTGLFSVYADVPITAELFVKNRWSVLKPIDGAVQLQAMT